MSAEKSTEVRGWTTEQYHDQAQTKCSTVHDVYCGRCYTKKSAMEANELNWTVDLEPGKMTRWLGSAGCYTTGTLSYLVTAHKKKNKITMESPVTDSSSSGPLIHNKQWLKHRKGSRLIML